MRHWMGVSALRAVFLFSFFLVANSVFSYPLVPDPQMTQGEICTKNDPDFAYYRYPEKIPYCKRSVSWERRQEIYNDYHIPSECRRRYTIDHFIPLSLGGDNSDINLWPEHVLVRAMRPHLEGELYLALKEGRLTQEEAIDIVVSEKMKENQKILNATFKDKCDEPSNF